MPSATAVAAARDLAWTPLAGLDLRGAYVATGAGSGSMTVLLGADTKTGALLSWTSTDGAHWARHWLDGSTFGGNTPTAIVAIGSGFVASGWTLGADLRTTPAMWTSPNGVDWSLAADPSGRFEVVQQEVASTTTSVVMSGCCLASGKRALMTSSDGISWVDSTPPEAGRDPFFHLAATGDGYLAISTVDLAGDGVTTLGAWRSPDGRSWTRDTAIDVGLKQVTGVNAVIGAADRFIVVDDSGGYEEIASDGSLIRIDPATAYGGPVGGVAGLAWLGPPDDRQCVAGWVRSDDAWRPVEPYPDGCADEPVLTRRVALPDGWLLVASGSTAGDESVWAIRPKGSVPSADAPGGPTPTPPVTAIPAVPTGTLTAKGPCPADPRSIAEIVRLTAYDRAACFGSGELMFRAWVVDPGEGYGGTCRPLTPRWLNVCVRPDWWLAEGKASTERLDALKRPDAAGDLKGVGRWVTVTGHFDDPAAATCRLEAGEARIGAPPTSWYVLRCREQFAVTRIETTH